MEHYNGMDGEGSNNNFRLMHGRSEEMVLEIVGTKSVRLIK
jgi:hypothetical protein